MRLFSNWLLVSDGSHMLVEFMCNGYEYKFNFKIINDKTGFSHIHN